MNSLSNLEKEVQSRRDHNTCYQTMLQGQHNQNGLVLAQEQTYRSIEQNRELRNKPMYLWSVNIWQSGKEHNME